MKTNDLLEFMVCHAGSLFWLLLFTLVVGSIGFIVHLIRPARSKKQPAR